MLNIEKYKILIRWILVFLIMAVIFSFSSQTGEESKAQSVSVASKLLELFGIVGEDLRTVVRTLRKLAHFGLFALLGASVCHAFSGYNINKAKVIIYSMIICLVYAISDEVHQGFVPGRGPQIKDVLIDFSGSFTGSGLVMILYKIKNSGRNKQK